MDANRWRQISRLFDAARARAGEERSAFLTSACGGDAALRREVESLLAHDTRADAFFLALAAEGVVGRITRDAEPPSGAVAPGMTLGTYRIDRLLGRGGMGAVFQAYDTTLHRPVALKVLTGTTADQTVRARLLREGRNAAALNHPHICTIHEVGEVNGAAFIAMEYVEGCSLRDRLDEGALFIEEAVRLGIQAAEALAYAHDHGVVHRDFKAANVIVTPTGQFKIVDFGLARRADALMASATTMASAVPAGAAVGTPYAMAPEQVRGETADARSDIWALGVLLYEIVTGAKPFEAPTIPAMFSSIVTGTPAPLPDGVPSAIRAIIARCLEKEPARRYQRADDIRCELEAFQRGSVAPWSVWRYRLTQRRSLTAAASLVATLALLAGLNVGGIRDRLVGNVPVAAPIKLAVLPLENLTGDPEQEYFSDGLTEELITELGRLHPQRLLVIARTSSMRYKHSDAPLNQIGRELGVDYVMEGSARREGNRVRISATLVEVRDQTQRWTDSFDRDLAGILSLQSDVARGVARSLALTLLPEEQSRLATTRPVNPEAYEAYLNGHSHALKLTRADLDTALQYFELALQKDPSSALAYTGIASVWSGRQQMGFVVPSEAAPRLRAAVAKALELDSTLPEAHYRLAVQAAWTDWDWAAAEREFQLAIELNPNYVPARELYSHYLLIMKRPAEAMAQIERARQLDPFSDNVQAFYAVDLQHARRFDEAIVQFRKALATAPGSPLSLSGLARSLERVGKYEEALATEKALWAARGDREAIEALDHGYTEGGYRRALRRTADTLAARPPVVTPNAIAILYLRAGENERALTWLEKAYEARDPNLPYASSAPWYDPLRSDPRFRDLLRRMNLPV